MLIASASSNTDDLNNVANYMQLQDCGSSTADSLINLSTCTDEHKAQPRNRRQAVRTCGESGKVSQPVSQQRPEAPVKRSEQQREARGGEAQAGRKRPQIVSLSRDSLEMLNKKYEVCGNKRRKKNRNSGDALLDLKEHVMQLKQEGEPDPAKKKSREEELLGYFSEDESNNDDVRSDKVVVIGPTNPELGRKIQRKVMEEDGISELVIVFETLGLKAAEVEELKREAKMHRNESRLRMVEARLAEKAKAKQLEIEKKIQNGETVEPDEEEDEDPDLTLVKLYKCQQITRMFIFLQKKFHRGEMVSRVFERRKSIILAKIMNYEVDIADEEEEVELDDEPLDYDEEADDQRFHKVGTDVDFRLRLMRILDQRASEGYRLFKQDTSRHAGEPYNPRREEWRRRRWALWEEEQVRCMSESKRPIIFGTPSV